MQRNRINFVKSFVFQTYFPKFTFPFSFLSCIVHIKILQKDFLMLVWAKARDWPDLCFGGTSGIFLRLLH